MGGAASDADPFAGEWPAVAKRRGAAAGRRPFELECPAGPGRGTGLRGRPIVAPGMVEQLPASAYPEPVTRGLYGGPLWLDMQGLQWPYMPQSGVGISGYGWIDNNYR